MHTPCDLLARGAFLCTLPHLHVTLTTSTTSRSWRLSSHNSNLDFVTLTPRQVVHVAAAVTNAITAPPLPCWGVGEEFNSTHTSGAPTYGDPTRLCCRRTNIWRRLHHTPISRRAVLYGLWLAGTKWVGWGGGVASWCVLFVDVDHGENRRGAHTLPLMLPDSHSRLAPPPRTIRPALAFKAK